jgi:hypothetical protein
LRKLAKALKRLGNKRGLLYQGDGVPLSQLKRGFDLDDDEAIFARSDAVNGQNPFSRFSSSGGRALRMYRRLRFYSKRLGFE